MVLTLFLLSHIRTITKIYANCNVFYSYFRRAFLVIIGDFSEVNQEVALSGAADAAEPDDFS